jgi:hypothetical protein
MYGMTSFHAVIRYAICWNFICHGARKACHSTKFLKRKLNRVVVLFLVTTLKVYFVIVFLGTPKELFSSEDFTVDLSMMVKLFDYIDSLEWGEDPHFRVIDSFIEKLMTLGDNAKMTVNEPWINVHSILFSD